MVILQEFEDEEIVCNNCDVLKFVTDYVTGEITCSNCGCVLSENSEDRSSIAERTLEKLHTGPKISLKIHDKGLSTIIGVKNKDCIGKSLPINTAQTFNRLRKWDNRAHANDSSVRNLRYALQELDKIQSKLSLSDPVIERAALFYRKAFQRKLIRGRTMKGVAAACLYVSCKDLKYDRTMSEIAEQIHIRRKDIAKAHRVLFYELGFTNSVYDPKKSVGKIASKINIKEKTIRKAIQILDLAHNAGIVAGKNPESIAASAIYAACVITGEGKSQREIAEASKTSSVSIRSRIFEFREKLNVFLEDIE